MIPVMLLSLLLAACGDKDEVMPQFSIMLNQSRLDMVEGETTMLTVQGVPKGAVVKWMVDDAKVVKVTDGKVDALSEGKAFITATAASQGVQSEAKCEVTVKRKADFVKFVDANLEKRVFALTPSPDVNHDGKLSYEEAAKITTLDFGFANPRDVVESEVIKSVAGLEHFVNLETLNLKYHAVSDPSPLYTLTKLKQLNLGGNGIKAIALSTMPELTDIRLYDNKELTELNLSGNLKIESLYLQRTGLTQLNLTPCKNLKFVLLNGCSNLQSVRFSGLPNLERIDMVKCRLASIEAADLPLLTELHADHNKISMVNLKNLPSLQRLNLYSNQIKAIDLDLPKLMFLFLHDNQLTNIDLSRLPMLFQLIITNNPITKLDFSKNQSLCNLEAVRMPALEEINLKNNGYNEDAEYDVVEDNTKLRTIRVDAGAEYNHVKKLVAANPGIQVVVGNEH